VQVRFNGVPIYTPTEGRDAPDMNAFEGREFDAIEYYAGSSQIPVEYGGPGAACGVLLLWTRLQ
jgi:hypothetical protein